MKPTQLLTFDGRGFLHCSQVLANYLPAFDPGLAALGLNEGLLAGATLQALETAYGKKGASLILRDAGVVSCKAISDGEAGDRLAARVPSELPARVKTEGATQGWHYEEVNVEPAWNQLGGAASIDWGNVKVGQIDTGYTQHPVFGFGGTTWVDVAAGRTIFAPNPGPNPGNPGPGGGLDPLADIRMYDGHGTRVGSVICGFDPAAPGGVYLGIAPKVPLVPVRVANTVLCGHAQTEIAEALNYLVNTVKVSVVNISMGFLPGTPTSRLRSAVNNAYISGVIVVCAAGQPFRPVAAPASMRRTIAVAGSAYGRVTWGRSAYGPTVDWSAPAKDLYRANMKKLPTPIYGDGDGTSYATAITSGAAALWLAHHGSTLADAYPQPWQRVAAFKAAAKATAVPMDNQQPGSFGAGILNIGALLNYPLPALDPVQEDPA